MNNLAYRPLCIKYKRTPHCGLVLMHQSTIICQLLYLEWKKVSILTPENWKKKENKKKKNVFLVVQNDGDVEHEVHVEMKDCQFDLKWARVWLFFQFLFIILFNFFWTGVIFYCRTGSRHDRIQNFVDSMFDVWCFGENTCLDIRLTRRKLWQLIFNGIVFESIARYSTKHYSVTQ